MCLKHPNSDYIKDVDMEINTAFYPPPNILVPNCLIPPIREFDYAFKTEKDMILKYEVERRRREEEEKLKLKQLSTNADAPVSSFFSFLTAEEEKTEAVTVKPIPLMPLTPSSNVVFSSSVKSFSSRKKDSAAKLHGFEEFEIGSTVFDLIELRSLDDRTELEKLIN